MSTKENKALVGRFFEEVLLGGNFTLADELFAATHLNHFPGNPVGLPPGLEGFKQLIAMYRAAFPDLHATIEDQIAEGDKVVTRARASGTNTGSLFGMPATGKFATVISIQIDRIADGKIVESWANFDQLGMLQQLGLFPSSAQAG
jgi:predicted ester cyclase